MARLHNLILPLSLLSLLSLLCLSACGDKDDTSRTSEEYEGDEAGECSDEADNDRDGLFDCDDEGCAGSPDCEVAESNYGTEEEPGISCADIYTQRPDATSGEYWITTGTSQIFEVYCDMTTDDGGWTLVASVHNIDSNNWSCSSPSDFSSWTDSSEFGYKTGEQKISTPGI